MTNSYAATNLLWPSGEEHRHFDWTNVWDEETQDSRYEYWEATPDNRNIVYHSGSGTGLVFTSHGELAVRQPYELSFEEEAPEGPLMSGHWVLGEYLRSDLDVDLIAWRMRSLSVCLVKVDEQFGVALTGGGMNLSWHLAAGAIAAGYFPWPGLELDSWEWGLSTVGPVWAKRIRAARRYWIKKERRRLSYQLNTIESRWR